MTTTQPCLPLLPCSLEWKETYHMSPQTTVLSLLVLGNFMFLRDWPGPALSNPKQIRCRWRCKGWWDFVWPGHCCPRMQDWTKWSSGGIQMEYLFIIWVHLFCFYMSWSGPLQPKGSHSDAFLKDFCLPTALFLLGRSMSCHILYSTLSSYGFSQLFLVKSFNMFHSCKLCTGYP